MAEKEPKPQSLVESIQEEFGVNLEEQIHILRASGESLTVELLLQKIETLLLEAGVELDPQKKDELRKILQERSREIGLIQE